MQVESIRHYIKRHYPSVKVTVKQGTVFVDRDIANTDIVLEPVRNVDDHIQYKVVEYNVRSINHRYINSRWQLAKTQLDRYFTDYEYTMVHGNPADFVSVIPKGWKRGAYVYVQGTLKPDIDMSAFKYCGYDTDGVLFQQSNTRKISRKDVFELGLLIGARAEEAALIKAQDLGIEATNIEDIMKEVQI